MFTEPPICILTIYPLHNKWLLERFTLHNTYGNNHQLRRL